MPPSQRRTREMRDDLSKDSTKWHLMGSSDALKKLETTEKGLNVIEARTRLEKYGLNEIVSVKKFSSLKLFLKQFTSFLMIILITASIISAAVDLTKNEFPLDSAFILGIVIASGVLGFAQEYRAEQSMEALKRMAAPKAKVLRNSVESVVESREVVPGDVLILDAGTKIPADARILEEANLRVDEAILTGESTPVEKAAKALEKDVQIQDRKNMLFSSTIVTYGRGKAVVVATAMNTEFGKIATMMEEAEKRETPLEQRLQSVGKWLGITFLFVVTFVAAFGFLRGELDPLSMFIWAVSLAVAAIPEALTAVVTGSLAIGMRRMAKHNAIIRRLPAVETLGCATVICSDKTGTLTKNEMTVRRVFTANRFIDVSGVGVTPTGEFSQDNRKIDPSRDKDLMKLLTVGTLCNDSQLIYEDKSWRVTGDTTEAAILVAAAKAGVNKEELDTTRRRVGELPFASERKRMSTIHPAGRDFIICVKGAPEIILELSTQYLAGDKEQQLTDEVRKSILNANEAMTSKALRVLGIAYRQIGEVPEGKLSPEEIERELVFAGLVGMIDPPRPEAKEAVQKCKTAGIKVVMITGDHKLTAEAVAKELGLLDPSHGSNDEKSLGHTISKGDKTRPRVLTGSELDKMGDKELVDIANEVAVYARVSPEHKLRIVSALKANGHVVAMTGDGVNDAPALKNSDIGVAMGITGTDVTKEASDMVLSDDNFATIVSAIEEGRGIYDNIKKYLVYLLSSNVGEVLTLFIASLLGFPLPLIALQLLWINLATDGFPALALSIDPPDIDIMSRPPRDPKESIFTGRIKKMIFGIGFLMPMVILPVFYIYNPHLTGTPDSPTPEYILAMTMAFTTMVMFEMFNVYTCRSEKYPVSRIGFFKNKYLNIAVLSSILLQLIVLYIPVIDAVIDTTPLMIIDWIIVLVAGCMPLVAGEIAKAAFPPRTKQEISTS